MAITLDGTGGITTPAESISGALNVSGTTTLGSGVLNIGSGQIYKDASGNLGIGTTSPPSGSRVAISGGALNFIDTSSRDILWGTSSYVYITGNQGTGVLAMGTASTERARIDSSGNLLVGTTSTTLTNGGAYIAPGSGTLLDMGHAFGSASGNYYALFRYAGTLIGSITQNGTTGVLYNTSSDQRLKENIVDAPGALASINAIKVRSFDWKADGSHVDYGYIAQELIDVAPETVHAPIDTEEMMGVDFGKLTPRLVKAIQELTARLEALENK